MNKRIVHFIVLNVILFASQGEVADQSQDVHTDIYNHRKGTTHSKYFTFIIIDE